MGSDKVKREIDRVVAAGGMLVLLPVLGAAALICGLGGEGVLYRQERIGKDGVPFVLYKFRTLQRRAPILPRSLLGDARCYCIPGGAFLRASGIDELPQLWNVLRGEMSLVGPRPLLPAEGEIHALRQKAGVYTLRPGITGLAQLCGDPPAAVKVKLDRLYLEQRSMGLDLAIVAGTLRLLAGRHGRKKLPPRKFGKNQRNF